MKKKDCPKCGGSFSLKGGNYSRHVKVCDGTYKSPKDKGKCPHCKNVFDVDLTNHGWFANHVRWCTDNPARNSYNNVKSQEALRTPEARTKAAIQIKQAWKDGKYENVDRGTSFKGKRHKRETKEIMREKALSSPHRRLRRKLIDYNGVTLDSTWELALAQRLDFLGIKWTRPEPVKWVDREGVWHHYFPDFYLPEWDIYLDPKNPIALNRQRMKVECLMQQLPNLLILKSLQECKEFCPFPTVE